MPPGAAVSAAENASNTRFCRQAAFAEVAAAALNDAGMSRRHESPFTPPAGGTVTPGECRQLVRLKRRPRIRRRSDAAASMFSSRQRSCAAQQVNHKTRGDFFAIFSSSSPASFSRWLIRHFHMFFRLIAAIASRRFDYWLRQRHYCQISLRCFQLCSY